MICTPTTKLLPDLKTNLAVHVHGTVDQLVNGTAPAATATATVLGLPVSVNLDGITSGIGNVLSSHLLNGTNGVSTLASSLDSKVIDPTTTALLGPDSSVENALTKVLSVKLNNQSTSGGTFTETALQVSALPDGTEQSGNGQPRQRVGRAERHDRRDDAADLHGHGLHDLHHELLDNLHDGCLFIGQSIRPNGPRSHHHGG